MFLIAVQDVRSPRRSPRKKPTEPGGRRHDELAACEDRPEGLDVEFDWKTFRGTQSSWKNLDYFQRPQDMPYTETKDEVIQGACVWGTICNASAGMGKMVPDAYGVSPWAIFVRPDSRIRRPEDLKDV